MYAHAWIDDCYIYYCKVIPLRFHGSLLVVLPFVSIYASMYMIVSVRLYIMVRIWLVFGMCAVM